MNEIFKALSDSTRREILELLKKEGKMSAGTIASHFNISHPSISHHLKILKDCGVVKAKRDGQHIMYSLNTTVFQGLLVWLYGIKGGDSDEG